MRSPRLSSPRLSSPRDYEAIERWRALLEHVNHSLADLGGVSKEAQELAKSPSTEVSVHGIERA